MALDISLEITSITADRLTGVLTDNTVFGSPEVERTDVGVYVVGQKMLADSTVGETLTLTGDTDDPQTDSSWQFNIPRDGWFRFLYVAPPDYDVAVTYAQYDAVQDPATSIVYRSKVAGNVGNALNSLTHWEVIATPALLALNSGEANESLNLDSQIYSVVLLPNSEYGYANAISEASEECCNINCSFDDLKLYIRLAALVDGAYVRSDRSQFPQAERIARKLEAILE
jgi:hypothetical protein